MYDPLADKAASFCRALILLVTTLTLSLVGFAAPQLPPPGLGLAHPAVAAVARVQVQHTPAMMRVPGVFGTATGLDRNGELVIRVFIEATTDVRSIPRNLGGIPVEVEVTESFRARQADPTVKFEPPIPIGVSTGHPEITAGTIGCRVKDAQGRTFALSNNHVFANSNAGEIGALLVLDDGDPILQPGPYDGGDWPEDEIGWLYDYVPIVFRRNAKNLMDAAVVYTDLIDVATPGLPGTDSYGVPNLVTVPAQLGLQVQKYGRTTRWTYGVISDINATVTVTYGVLRAKFVNQILITPGTFSDGGDSGSLIVTDDGYNHPVGLLFAGNSSYTIANPIQTVMDEFNVTIDDGTLSAARGTVSGTVTEAAAGGIAGAKVTMNVTGHYTVTDNEGRYTLNYVPTGSQDLTAAAVGYADHSQTVSVSEGGDTAANFVLEPLGKGSISGTVTDATTDLGIGSAVVTVIETGDSVTADANGAYAIAAVPEGTHTLSASAGGYADQFQTVTVRPSEDSVANFALEPVLIAPYPYAEEEAASYSTTLAGMIRMQQVYGIAHFGTEPIMLTSLAFRLDNAQAASSSDLARASHPSAMMTNGPNAGVGASGVESVHASVASQATETINIKVRLSATGKSPDGLDLTFDNNLGLDVTEVFGNGSGGGADLVVTAMGGAGSDGPNAFEIVIPFTRAFYFDPANGNLLVDISTYTPGSMNVDTSSAGPENPPDDWASRMFASDPDATATTSLYRESGADVIQFTYELPNYPPSVAIAEPIGGSTFDSGESILFSGSASDPEDGDLTYSIAWTSDLDGSIGAGGTFSTSLSDGAHTITAEATDSLGSVGSASVTITVGAPNSAPTVTIESPLGGSTFSSGASISFDGSAQDLEDGVLTSSLAWTSDLDGAIGTGGSFSAVLTDGTHTITAEVTDSGGVTSTDSVGIIVTTESSTVTLTADGYKVRGIRYVDLTWTGAAGAVDVYRDNQFIKTISAGTHQYTDNLGRLSGTFVYQVYDVKGSSWSNEAMVIF